LPFPRYRTSAPRARISKPLGPLQTFQRADFSTFAAVSPPTTPQPWEKFTDPSPVPERSSLRPLRYGLPRLLRMRFCHELRILSILACYRSSPRRSPRPPRAVPRRESCMHFLRPAELELLCAFATCTDSFSYSYTRRFVNVTMTGGKRKMNPNPGS
jgi:hypothetical protein